MTEAANAFGWTAKLLRSGDERIVRATLSNNINVILAALDRAAAAPAPVSKKDPRIDILVEIMHRTRWERMKRMINVGDRRFKKGRVLMAEEAAEMLAELDKFSREETA